MNFKIGEIVCDKETRQPYNIIGINENGKYTLKDFKGNFWGWVKESTLIPLPKYSEEEIREPRFQLGDRPLLKEGRQRSTITEVWWKDYGFYYRLGSIKNGNRDDELFPEVMFAEVDEKKEDEKRFILAEILRGKEKQEFHSYAYGSVILDEIDEKRKLIYIRQKGKAIGRELYDFEGKISQNGFIDLYPSEELLRKYPLEAEKAWEEWENTIGSLEKVIELNANKFHCEECIDDSDYSIAKGGILIGLQLSQKFSEEEIKNYLNNNKQWIQQ